MSEIMGRAGFWRFAFAGVAASMLLGIPAVSGAAAPVMRIGTVTVPPHQQNATMSEFKKRIEAKLGDRLKVQLYPASQLGTIPQMMQGLQNGSVQSVILPTGFFGPMAPALNVMDLPYLFADSEQAFELLNHGADAPLRDYLKTKGMIPLAWLLARDRTIILKKPITKMEDFKGRKIRTFPSPVAQGEINAWGAAATIIDSAEVPVALQQGTIDGVASDITFMHAMKLYQSAKYLLMAPRGVVTNVFMVSRVWFEGLPPDIQSAVATTAKDVVLNFEADYLRKYGDKAMAEMKRGGLQVIEPSPQLVSQMREASKVVHEKYKASVPQAPAIYASLEKAIARKTAAAAK